MRLMEENLISKVHMLALHEKQMCVSVYGVKLWNSLDDDFKHCSDIIQFKRIYKEKIMGRYELSQ